MTPPGEGSGRSGEHKSLSRQVQGVSSQVLTHRSERGEECGAGPGREGSRARLPVVVRDPRGRDAGSAPGLAGRGSGAPR